MKISHHWHGWSPDHLDPTWAQRVDDEAEETSSTAATRERARARRLARAEHRLERASEALATAEAKRKRKTDIHRLTLLVERRRQEMLAIQREMQASPAGSQHRGRGSHRGVATGEVL